MFSLYIEGVDYHFIEREKFEEMILDGKFLESALVHGNYYGTSIETIEKVQKSGSKTKKNAQKLMCVSD